LENGADTNAQGGKYSNALQAAASCGFEAVVRFLLENGADIHTQGGGVYGNALQTLVSWARGSGLITLGKRGGYQCLGRQIW
jgi:ankyrin repeat protein